MLLQLLRGAGLKGLSAMPVCRRFGDGWHVRPLLDVAQRDLLRFAQDAHVEAVGDPMNRDVRFDRAYLRELVWPLLQTRWPGAASAMSRAARHFADAQELLDNEAACSVDRLRDGTALSVAGLRALSAPRQRNALRRWIAASGVLPPPSARLSEAVRQVMDADDDHLPAIIWGNHALRRYRGRLFLTPATPPSLGERRAWAVFTDAGLDLGRGPGDIALVAANRRLGRRQAASHAHRTPARGRRNSQTESLAPGHTACSTFANLGACCLGCAMHCRWSMPAHR